MHSDHGIAAAVVWVAACLVAPFHRAGFAVLAALAFGGWALADENMQSTHAVLIGWVALILAVDVERDRLLRTQLVALYLFAFLNKLNGDYMRGDALRDRMEQLPFGFPFMPAATAGVLVEGWLVWAVWKRNRFALPVAAALHVTIPLVVGQNAYQWTLLAAYNGLVLFLVWWVTRGRAAERSTGTR